MTIAYKGFDKNFKCRGFQFEVGKTYEHDGKVKICKSGFHACENPFDVWSYYDISDGRFAEVGLSGTTKTHSEDSKIAAAKIEIKAELTLGEFIPKAVQWLIEHCKTKSGERVRASSGYCVKIGSSGDCAKIGSSGYYAQIASSGDCVKIGSSGYYAQIASSGDCVKIGSSGYCVKIGSSGDCVKIGSSGDYAQIGATGKNSVIASAGYAATVKGAKGTWVSVAEYNDDGKCVGFATGCIGKGKLKADTWYVAKGGKLVVA